MLLTVHYLITRFWMWPPSYHPVLEEEVLVLLESLLEERESGGLDQSGVEWSGVEFMCTEYLLLLSY